jgi:hypothetical protein
MRRGELAELLVHLLPAEPGDDTTTIRPDPVGDLLVLDVLGADRAAFTRCLKKTSTEEQLRICWTLSRAAQWDKQGAADLAAAALKAKPALWRPALAIAADVGGPFVPALERLADQPDTPLALTELANAIPFGHAALRNLALIAARTAVAATQPTGAGDQAAVAASLNNLAIRQSEAGDRAAALATAEQAIGLYRQLAGDNPQALLPDLAMSLNNLALRGWPEGVVRWLRDVLLWLWRCVVAIGVGWFGRRRSGSGHVLTARIACRIS